MSVNRDISDPEAVKISDALLEITGEAILARDFSRFAPAFALPHPITTFDTKRTVETRAELEAIFDANCAYFDELQVTDIARKCLSADFDGPDCVKAMHITHLMSGNNRVKDPYPGFSVLTRTDGVWRVSKSDYAVGADAGLTLALNKINE